MIKFYKKPVAKVLKRNIHRPIQSEFLSTNIGLKKHTKKECTDMYYEETILDEDSLKLIPFDAHSDHIPSNLIEEELEDEEDDEDNFDEEVLDSFSEIPIPHETILDLEGPMEGEEGASFKRITFETSVEDLQESLSMRELIEKEKELERKSVEDAVERYRQAVESATQRGDGVNLPPGRKILVKWFSDLLTRIKDEQKSIYDQKIPKNSLKAISPLLTLLPADKLVVLTLHEMLTQTLSEDVHLKRLSLAIGQVVHAEYNYKKLKNVPFGLQEVFERKSQVVFKLNNKAKQLIKDDTLEMSTADYITFGTYLIDIVLETAKINEHPAFVHEIIYRNDLKLGVISLHQDVKDLIQDDHSFKELTIYPRYVPMVVTPRPWKSYKDGGYLEKNHIVMRTKGSSMQVSVLKDSIMKDLLDGLNVLNETSWRVNDPVLDVFLQVWEMGGGLGELPSRFDVPLPLEPENKDAYEIYKWKKQVKKVQTVNRNLHSRRCDTLYKIQVAKDFRESNFYFPHNIDFRGRSYPIPPHLNHMGADMNRGLLIFDKGRRIGKRGIFWLKIHLANLVGQDKLTMNERVRYIDDNFDKILDSAQRPLDGNRWWLDSENPWQTLAACIELVNCDGNEEFISHLPIQIDGSCNGLQHYAALGRDYLGGLHVNLLPSDRPMDVYSGVLQVVLKYLERDLKEGNPLAKELQGKVARSTIKQTVMTTVYGVTFIGAKEQILKRLKERGDINDDQVVQCAIYLAKLTFLSLGEVFQGAFAIMEWLNECAHLISTENSPVIWITPLGLPVLQPYRAQSKKRIQTILQSVLLSEENDELPVSRERQKSAFPPNYVHSLDASHMLLTANAAKREGISFASVHDSYWTHASDTDLLNKLLREEFVYLHSQPLLETLLYSFQQSFPNVKFPDLPPKGNLDITRVKDSKYFFD